MPKGEIGICAKVGVNVLHSAAEGGNMDVVRYLVEDCEQPVDERGGYLSETILTLAASNSNFNLAKYVLQQQKKAKGKQGCRDLLNMQDNDGCTVLHIAASKGLDDIVDLFLSYNSDKSLQLKCKKGNYTAMDMLDKRHPAYAYWKKRLDPQSNATE